MIKAFNNLYSNTSKIKWLISLLIFLSIIFSTGYIKIIIDDIKQRERDIIELYANSIEYLANYKNDTNTDFLFQKIVITNTSIPVIITDRFDNIIDSKNVIQNKIYKEDSKRIKTLDKALKEMKSDNKPIKILL